MRGRNFAPFPVLKTERLTLRQLVIGDANEIFALRSDPEVNRYLDREPAKSIDDAKTFIQIVNANMRKNDSIYWVITLNSTDKLIGTTCLFNFSDDNLKVEIGYELLPNFHGKGIMREATSKVIDYGFQHIGLNSIEAHTHSENQTSTRLLENLKFKRYSIGADRFIIFRLTGDD